MKVGDLIQYKDKDITCKGIVLNIPSWNDDMVLVYFIDKYPDYVWEYSELLEVASCKLET